MAITAPRSATAGSVSAALFDVETLGPSFTITVSDGGRRWRPAVDAYACGFTDRISAAAKRYGTGESRVAVSLAQLDHAVQLWSPVLACTLLHGIVPCLRELQCAEDGPELRSPFPAGWHIDDADHGRLTGLLYRTVVEEHLEALAAGLRIKIAPGLLYGNAAAALVHAARTITTARPELCAPTHDVVSSLLAVRRLTGTGSIVGPGLDFRRRSCCLNYRTPGGENCRDCGLARKEGQAGTPTYSASS
jgi:hypothetical protein